MEGGGVEVKGGLGRYRWSSTSTENVSLGDLPADHLSSLSSLLSIRPGSSRSLQTYRFHRHSLSLFSPDIISPDPSFAQRRCAGVTFTQHLIKLT